MKTIYAPFIEGLNNLTFNELQNILELKGSKDVVGTVNWPTDYGYKPSCTFTIAHCTTHFAVLFDVRGLDIRAVGLTDNSSVWEDSCCEFFCKDPNNNNYYNFEINCIGSVLSAFGGTREGRTRRTQEEMNQIIRFSSLQAKEYNEENNLFSWQVAMVIPKQFMGITNEKQPHSIKGNFYKCGDKTKHPHFLSWNPVLTPSPDFHRPDFFGEIILEQA